MLQAWIPDESLYFTYNKVSWYLSLCLFTYFVFPWFFEKTKNLSKNKLIGVGAVILVIQVTIGILANAALPAESRAAMLKWITYICPLYRTGDFFLGCLLGFAMAQTNPPERQTKHPDIKYTVLELIFVGIIALEFILRKTVSPGLTACVLWYPSSLLGVWLFYLKRGWITKVLCNRPLIFLGNISAQAFLIHQMTIHLIAIVIDNTVLLTLLSFCITIVASVVYIKLENVFFTLVRSNRRSPKST